MNYVKFLFKHEAVGSVPQVFFVGSCAGCSTCGLGPSQVLGVLCHGPQREELPTCQGKMPPGRRDASPSWSIYTGHYGSNDSLHIGVIDWKSFSGPCLNIIPVATPQIITCCQGHVDDSLLGIKLPCCRASTAENGHSSWDWLRQRIFGALTAGTL